MFSTKKKNLLKILCFQTCKVVTSGTQTVLIPTDICVIIHLRIRVPV
uniref:Uncharacterized protein n=1 Tax=Anguilla anguilla TaxID=7936 RepID=A0A0E9SPC3_ANGAN